jgi:hypothetical protein
VAHPQIAVFARLAKDNTKPLRKIEGQRTMLGRTMHGIAYDGVHDEILVPQPFAQAVLIFSGSISGEQPPTRYIQGPLTQLSNLDKVEIDPVHNEVFVPDGDKILVFSRTANGNVAPLRVMKMPKDVHVDADAVDYVNNVVIASSDAYTFSQGKPPKLLIFNRTDDGDVTPKGVIAGPKTMLTGTFGIRADPAKGLVLVCMNGPVTVGPYEGAFVGVWSINDSGDVPPRWTIGGPNQSLKQPRGVDLDVKNKSVVVSDKVLNSVLTYYFPEIF